MEIDQGLLEISIETLFQVYILQRERGVLAEGWCYEPIWCGARNKLQRFVLSRLLVDCYLTVNPGWLTGRGLGGSPPPPSLLKSNHSRHLVPPLIPLRVMRHTTFHSLISDKNFLLALVGGKKGKPRKARRVETNKKNGGYANGSNDAEQNKTTKGRHPKRAVSSTTRTVREAYKASETSVHKHDFPELPSEHSTDATEQASKRPRFLHEEQVHFDVHSDMGPVGGGNELGLQSSSSKSLTKRSPKIHRTTSSNRRHPYPTPSPTPKKANGTKAGRRTLNPYFHPGSPPFWQGTPTPIDLPQWEPRLSVETLGQPISSQNFGIPEPDCRPILSDCIPPVWASVRFFAIIYLDKI